MKVKILLCYILIVSSCTQVPYGEWANPYDPDGTDYLYENESEDLNQNTDSENTSKASYEHEITNLEYLLGDEELTLTWDNPDDSNFDHNKIFYGNDNTDTEFLGTIDNTGTVITGLTNATDYSFLIKSVNSNDETSEGVEEVIRVGEFLWDFTTNTEGWSNTYSAGLSDQDEWMEGIFIGRALVRQEIVEDFDVLSVNINSDNFDRTLTHLRFDTQFDNSISMDPFFSMRIWVSQSMINSGAIIPRLDIYGDSQGLDWKGNDIILSPTTAVTAPGWYYFYKQIIGGTYTTYGSEEPTFENIETLRLLFLFSSNPASGDFFHIDYIRLGTTEDPNLTSGNSDLKIGDSYGGGIVFYLDDLGGGLIAAPEDITGTRIWGTYNNTVPGADGTALGTGEQNTLDIIAGDSSTSNAAHACADYSIVNDGTIYDDWFLPSKDELNAMFENLKVNDIGGFVDNDLYWTSSEDSSNNAWIQDFSNSYQASRNKDASLLVRPVRAF